MESKKYTYSNVNRISRFLAILCSILFIVVGLFFLCVFIFSLFNFREIESSYSSGLFWNFVGYCVWSPLFFVYIAHLNVDIEAEKGGLRIKFLLKSLFVNWSDIEDFKPAKTFGFLSLKHVRVLVTKNALTPFHRLY